MNIALTAIESCTEMPGCITAAEINSSTIDCELLSMLSENVLHGWLSSRPKVQKDL